MSRGHPKKLRYRTILPWFDFERAPWVRGLCTSLHRWSGIMCSLFTHSYAQCGLDLPQGLSRAALFVYKLGNFHMIIWLAPAMTLNVRHHGPPGTPTLLCAFWLRPVFKWDLVGSEPANFLMTFVESCPLVPHHTHVFTGSFFTQYFIVKSFAIGEGDSRLV